MAERSAKSAATRLPSAFGMWVPVAWVVPEAERPVAEFIKARTLPENLAVFEAAEVTAAPVYDIDQFIADPHVRARRLVGSAFVGSMPIIGGMSIGDGR